MRNKLTRSNPYLSHSLRCVLLLLLSSAALAQGNIGDGGSQLTQGPTIRSIPQGGFESLTSALTALTSTDNISGGIFTLKDRASGSKDADVNVLKLWNEFALGESDSNFVPLLQLSFSYLQFEQGFESRAGERSIESLGLGAGLGLRMKLFDDLFWATPRIKAEHTDYDFEGTFNQEDAAFDNVVFPDIDTWTYLPSLELQLRPRLKDSATLFIFGTKLTYLYVDAESSNSAIADFDSESWIWKNSLVVETPVTLGFEISELFFRPQISRIELYGDAREGFQQNNFYEVGADIFSRALLPNIFSELGISSRYVFEDRIHGWRLGVFGDFS